MCFHSLFFLFSHPIFPHEWISIFIPSFRYPPRSPVNGNGRADNIDLPDDFQSFQKSSFCLSSSYYFSRYLIPLKTQKKKEKKF